MSKVKNFFKNLFLDEEGEYEEALTDYAAMLGLNRPFQFVLIDNKATTDAEFEAIVKACKELLSQDLTRLGETYYEIPPALKSSIRGAIGNMVVTSDNSGNVDVSFHRCDEDGIWDGEFKKYPQTPTTGRKAEFFFVLKD